MLRSEREGHQRRYLGVAVCVAVGISLGMWHNRAARRGRPDVVTGIVRTITAPLVGAVTGVNRWGGRQFGWLVQGRTLAAENASLRAENARLRQQAARLAEADIDLQRLREEMGFQQGGPSRKLAADVIALGGSATQESIVIARGSRGGVRRNSAVLTPGGLVGRVIDVGPTTAVVLLLTDPESSVGAMVQRAQSRATGVCRGGGRDGPLQMLYLAREADVRVGDAVVSSGLGGPEGVFPKGLPIGTVASVAVDASGSSRKVTVRPAASFGRLEEVFVLP